LFASAAKGLTAQDRAAIISRLSGATQQAAVDLGVTIAAGRGGKVKVPSVTVPGLPGLLGGTGPVGLVSRAMVMKNMFDPATEEGDDWELDIQEDVKEECSKFGPVSFVHVDKHSAGFVYVFFKCVAGRVLCGCLPWLASRAVCVCVSCCCCSDLSSAAAAGSAIAGRKFAGKVIEVEFMPESSFVAKFPHTNFAALTGSSD
jgi:hypothetical protein